MKKMINKKGFTLIELLAVIVILGILIALAIPAVTRYIDESKKKTYIKTIDSLVDTVRYGINSNDSKYEIKPGKEKKFYFKDIKTEKGKAASPYGDFVDGYSYVLVQRSNDGNYTYKVQVKDSKDYVVSLTNVNSLSENSIKKVNDLTEEERTNLKGYPTYSIGDVITFGGSNWYVIKDSTESEDYVTLIKQNVLTTEEITSDYTYNSSNSMAYYWSPTCHQASTYGKVTYDTSDATGCKARNDYERSKIREMLEEKYLPTLDESNLKEVDGYKIRLMKLEELVNDFGYTYYSSGQYNTSEETPSWISNSVYWTMTSVGGSASTNGTVWFVENRNRILCFSVFNNHFHPIRPVINLYKSAIE